MRYFKRNGFRNTYYAVLERLFFKDVPFNAPERVEGIYNRDMEPDNSIMFSVLVPVYETKDEYLRAMTESVLKQKYTNFELIVADASVSDRPGDTIRSYNDPRIRYIRLSQNLGISENTNAALKESKGEFVALLDHDDIITEDALYESAKMILSAREKGIKPTLIYSDEDKFVTGEDDFFEANVKPKFNPDLFLSNNYICHFSVIDGSMARKLGFRREYDGAQDYDILLRTVAESEPSQILHIDRILYHWRCHENSTAADPGAKDYAYDAGRRAVEDYLFNRYKIHIPVKEHLHKGFYIVEWDDIFAKRPDVGAVGCPLSKNGKYITGVISEDGSEAIKGMNVHFSGYNHRAQLLHDVFGMDLRSVTPSKEMKTDYHRLMSELDKTLSKDEYEKKCLALSIEFAKKVKSKGLLFVYAPDACGTKVIS